MAISAVSHQEFKEDPTGATHAADNGPVFIMDRGRPTHVLLNINDYQNLVGGFPSILDLLAMPGIEDIEFEPPRLRHV